MATDALDVAAAGAPASLACRRGRKAGLARRWRILLGFAAGLVLLDVVVIATSDVWRRHDPHDYRERFRAARADQWDCVLVGGSPVSEGIDPALLQGMAWRQGPVARVFNFGLPGGTTTEVWHAAVNGLRSPPRLLVYGITASDVNDGRNEGQGPRHLMTSGDVLTWWTTCPKSAWWCTRHYVRGRIAQSWQLYDHRRGIRLWLARQWPEVAPEAAAEAEKKLRFSDAIAANHGFAPREEWRKLRLDRRRAQGWQLPEFAFLNGFRLGGHLLYLERLLDWANENDTTVVLVDMPVTAELEEVRHAGVYAEYRKVVSELAARRGVAFLDGGRKAVDLTEAHFADLTHLNAAGTQRFTTWLRQELTKRAGENRHAADRHAVDRHAADRHAGGRR
jgi:hypothetical protein